MEKEISNHSLPSPNDWNNKRTSQRRKFKTPGNGPGRTRKNPSSHKKEANQNRLDLRFTNLSEIQTMAQNKKARGYTHQLNKYPIKLKLTKSKMMKRPREFW